MLSQYQLKNEIGSLDVIITVLTSDLARQRGKGATNGMQDQLIKQMREALAELRRRRGQRKFLLTAIESDEIL
jgi:hypothetical protein